MVREVLMSVGTAKQVDTSAAPVPTSASVGPGTGLTGQSDGRARAKEAPDPLAEEFAGQDDGLDSSEDDRRAEDPPQPPRPRQLVEKGGGQRSHAGTDKGGAGTGAASKGRTPKPAVRGDARRDRQPQDVFSFRSGETEERLSIRAPTPSPTKGQRAQGQEGEEEEGRDKQRDGGRPGVGPSFRFRTNDSLKAGKAKAGSAKEVSLMDPRPAHASARGGLVTNSTAGGLMV
jgi:hypothetical protein